MEQLRAANEPYGVEAKGSAFRTKATEDGVSVGVARAFEEAGMGPLALLNLEPSASDAWGVLETTVGEVRALGLDAEVDPSDALHALIKPPPSGGKSRKLSKTARWVILPPGP